MPPRECQMTLINGNFEDNITAKTKITQNKTPDKHSKSKPKPTVHGTICSVGFERLMSSFGHLIAGEEECDTALVFISYLVLKYDDNMDQ